MPDPMLPAPPAAPPMPPMPIMVAKAACSAAVPTLAALLGPMLGAAPMLPMSAGDGRFSLTSCSGWPSTPRPIPTPCRPSGRVRFDLIKSHAKLPVKELLIVQHGDGLDRLDRMIIDNNGKASRLPLLVPLELHSNYSTCQAEYLLQLSLIYCIVHVGHKYPCVQRASDVEAGQELWRKAIRVPHIRTRSTSSMTSMMTTAATHVPVSTATIIPTSPISTTASPNNAAEL